MSRKVPPSPQAPPALEVRELRESDLDRVAAIDALHTGEAKPRYWRRVFRDFLEPEPELPRVGLVATVGEEVVAYLLGEVRAFEFGSEACGWVFAVGVDPAHVRERAASRLLSEACRRFQEAGVRRVRTMVQRDDIPLLSFFRANGFVGGSFVQLELDLEPENDDETP